MSIPSTTEQFLEVFARYNQAAWPMQVALYVLALVIVGLAWRRSGRWVFPLLAALWTWMGLVYHWIFFTAINPAACAFGADGVAAGGVCTLLALSGSSGKSGGNGQ
ncbi:MAG TPA: DUF6064 family protein [Chloroflexota bacterium]|nr:DUF6064 family protein [Chloroflexota bacterium]